MELELEGLTDDEAQLIAEEYRRILLRRAAAALGNGAYCCELPYPPTIRRPANR